MPAWKTLTATKPYPDPFHGRAALYLRGSCVDLNTYTELGQENILICFSSALFGFGVGNEKSTLSKIQNATCALH